MRLYRAFPWDPDADLGDPGGPLFRPSGSSGRVDNPELYRVLYLTTEPEAAIAEHFWVFDIWADALFVHPQLGLRYAVAQYELSDESRLCDLDNAQTLVDLRMRPSDVVVRDRKQSQAWAETIFKKVSHVGVRWWSILDAVWYVIALWDVHRLKVVGRPQPLYVASSEVQRAASAIIRRVER